MQFGPRVTFLFVPLGYLIAFASEFCSINWGFPYGDYYYIQATVDREVWILGVPFMDSLSYVFLAGCSYSSAIFLMNPLVKRTKGWVLEQGPGKRQDLGTCLLGAFLMVLLDIIVDPVALQGHKWFLGQIYGYKTQGAYFGIPMSNFGGWFLVAFFMIRVMQLLDLKWGRMPSALQWARVQIGDIWGLVLYLSVILFNLAVTFAIGETTLGIASCFISGTLFVMGAGWTYYKIKHLGF